MIHRITHTNLTGHLATTTLTPTADLIDIHTDIIEDIHTEIMAEDGALKLRCQRQPSALR